MTSLQPVVSEAELTLYLLVLIAVLMTISLVVGAVSAYRAHQDRRACRDALVRRPVEVVVKVDAKQFRADVTRGRQAALDLRAYERARGGRG